MLFGLLFDNWKNIILFMLIIIVLGLILILVNTNMGYAQAVDYAVETTPIIIPTILKNNIKKKLISDQETQQEKSVMKKISDTINKTIVGAFPVEIIKEVAKEKSNNIALTDNTTVNTTSRENVILKSNTIFTEAYSPKIEINNINTSILPRDDIPSDCKYDWTDDDFDINNIILDTRKDKSKIYFY